MNLKIRTRILFLIIISGSALLCVHSLNFPAGARLFPQLLLLTVMILASLGISQTFLAPDSDGNKSPKAEKSQPKKRKSRQPLILFAATILYLLLINALGFFFSSFLFMIGMVTILGFRSLMAIFAPALILLVFLYFLFVLQLRVSLPKGVLLHQILMLAFS